MTSDQIRNILLSHGYTIKPGHDDLMPYVYEAAEALIAAELRRLHAENAELIQELRNIASADWRKWDEEMRTPDEFVDWAKSRARFAIAKAEGQPC